MGLYAQATLVYGVEAPEDWGYACDEKLPPDGPLDWAHDGAADWDESSMTFVLYVKGSSTSVFETAEALGQKLPEPDVRDVVNARKLYEHLVPDGDWQPQWWLLPSYG